jgi:hypothetical protein
MTTALEIIDSAVKIGLGALVSGVATYLVTRKNHEHELRKTAREDRRTLIRSAARLLEEATTLLNQATYGIQRGDAEAVAGAKQLVDVINKLGEAKSIAILLGIRNLSSAVTDLRAGVVELAHYVGPEATGHDPREMNKLVAQMNDSWPPIHAELEVAYAKVSASDP